MQYITKEYLDENVVHVESKGRMCVCPLCGSQRLWDTSEINGRVHCFVCAVSFRCDVLVQSYEPAEPHPDIPGIRHYYKSVNHFYHGCISKEHEDYLSSRGIGPAEIEKYQLGFCPDERLSIYDHPLSIDAGIARRDKQPVLGDRITFPYQAEDETTDLRGRIFRTGTLKYKGLFSSSKRRGATYPYNWDYAVEKAKDLKYIIITEGEIKALVADMHGFPCVALPGMNSWRPCIVPSDWNIVLMFDNDKNSLAKMRIDRALDRIHAFVPRAKIATLPIEKQDKQDIDSFLLGPGDRVKWMNAIIDQSLDYKEYKKLRRF